MIRSFFDQQLRFVDKMITKVHGSILSIHGLVGEKDAQKWLTDSHKATVSTSSKVKTPLKKPRTRTATASATASTSAAALGEESGAAGGSGGSVSQSKRIPNEFRLTLILYLQNPPSEKEFLAEVLKTQYVHLIEMDEILREKLFILQVR